MKLDTITKTLLRQFTMGKRPHDRQTRFHLRSHAKERSCFYFSYETVVKLKKPFDITYLNEENAIMRKIWEAFLNWRVGFYHGNDPGKAFCKLKNA